MNQTTMRVLMAADPAGIVKGFAEADTAGKKFAATLQATANVGRSATAAIDGTIGGLEKLGRKMMMTGAGWTLSMGLMVKSAADLQASMLNVATISDFVWNNFASSTEQVVKMSTRLPVSAKELADGLYQIASSGFAGADGLIVLNAAATAGVAGLSSTAESAKALTAVLNAYGMSAAKSTEVSDFLFQTVNLGVLSFSDLVGVVGQSAGAAASAGIGIKELGAAIATMTRAGIDAAESGTSMNQLARAFIEPSEKMSAVLHSVGYESGVTAIKQDGLYGVLQKLRVATGGNVESLVAMFSEIRAARGALALMANEGKNYQQVMTGMNRSQGMTAQAFERQSTGFTMQLQLMRNTMKAFGMSTAAGLFGPLEAGMTIVGNFFGLLNRLPGPVKQLIGLFSGVGAVMTIAVGAFLAFGLRSMFITQIIGRLAMAVSGVLQALAGMAGVSATVSGQLNRMALSAENFGNKMMKIHGPMYATRTAIMGIGPVLSKYLINPMANGPGVIGRFGAGLQGAANHAGAMAQKVKTILPGLGALGLTAVAAGMVISSAFSKAEQKVADFAQTVNQKSLASVEHATDRLQSKLDAIQKKNSDDPFKQWGKGMVDAVGGIVGIDMFADDPIQQLADKTKFEAAQEQYRMFAENIRKNVIAAYKDIHAGATPTEHDVKRLSEVASKSGIDLTNSFKGSKQARQDLVNSYKEMIKWGGAIDKNVGVLSPEAITQLQKQAAEVERVAKEIGTAWANAGSLMANMDTVTMENPVDAQIKKWSTETIPNIYKFAANIQTAIGRGLAPEQVMDFMKAGPEKAGPILEAMVNDETNNLINLANGGVEALKILSVQAVDIASLTQQAINDKSGRKATELPKAIELSSVMRTHPEWSAEDIAANVPGFTKEEALSIAHDFGRELESSWMETYRSKALNKLWEKPFEDIKKNSKPIANSTASQLTNDWNAAIEKGISGSNIDAVLQKSMVLGGKVKMPENIKQVVTVEGKIDEAAKTAIDAIQLLDLSDEQKTFLINMVTNEAQLQKMEVVADFLKMPTSVKDVYMNFRTDPDAVNKFMALATQLGLGPKQYVIALEAIGTPEALAKAAELQFAMDVLRKSGKVDITIGDVTSAQADIDKAKKTLTKNKIPIDVDAVTALLTTKNVTKEIKKLKEAAEGKQAALDINDDVIKGKLKRAKQKILEFNDVHAHAKIFVDINWTGDTTKQVTIKSKKTEEADGGILRSFADGAHIAQIAPAGAMRLWAEQETGGEAYIPLSPSKRDRSTEILRSVAGNFGFMLQKFDTGGIIYGAAAADAERSAMANASQAYQFNLIRFFAQMAGNDPRAELLSLAKTYQDVREAAGAAAADQLINAGLMPEAFQDAASKIIEEGNKAKQAAEDLKRNIQDSFNSFSEPIKAAAELTKQFGKDTAFTKDTLRDYYTQQVQGTKDYADAMNKLAAAGLNRDTLQEMMKQGPASLNLAQQILAGGQDTIDFINSSVKTIGEIANGVGVSMTEQFYPNQVAPNLTLPVGSSTPYGSTTSTVGVQVGDVRIEINAPMDPGATISKEQVTTLLKEAMKEVVTNVNAGVK